jgi:hypothetical protein
MKLSNLPPNFVSFYNLTNLANNGGTIYVKIQKGMYGLPQVKILAQNLLKKLLNQHGYKQSKVMPGLWKHDWQPISSTHCVDNFGIKYVGQSQSTKNILQEFSTKTTNVPLIGDGMHYLGMNKDWDYDGRRVHVSMLYYGPMALMQFQHQAPNKPQHQPYPHVKSNYRAKAQYAEDTETSKLLPKIDKKIIQEVINTFPYYAQCIVSTMLAALGSIATQQVNPTENTMKKVQKFLDYASTHPNVIITYHASDMVLAGHSDTLYLSESKSRSWAGGNFSCPVTPLNH